MTNQARSSNLSDKQHDLLIKVPAVTIGFWIIKILATTLGETGGDTVSMTLGWGYLAGTALFMTILVALVYFQVAARRFHPFLYWATIIASTTAGTTLADFDWPEMARSVEFARGQWQSVAGKVGSKAMPGVMTEALSAMAAAVERKDVTFARSAAATELALVDLLEEQTVRAP